MNERSGPNPPELDRRATPKRAGSSTVGGRLRELLERNHGSHRGWARLHLAHFDYVAGRLGAWTLIRQPIVRRVVFVCLGNINRSAFAEAVAQRLGLHTCSFGLAASAGINAFAVGVETARRFGVSLSGRRTTPLADFEYQDGDLLAAMEVRHVNRLLDCGFPPQAIVLLGRWASPMRLHIHDPHRLSDSYFLTCFSVLDSAVRNLAVELRVLGHPVALQ